MLRVTELFGDWLACVHWNVQRDRWRVQWASNARFRTSVLCDTGNTPPELAYREGSTNTGTVDLLFDGCRERWMIVATRVKGSTKVAAILTRDYSIAKACWQSVTPDRSTANREPGRHYSARSASIGSAREARRAGG